MTAAFVLDASVVAALYVEEPFSDDVRAMLERLTGAGASLHAPELLLFEVANVLWKRARRNEVLAPDALRAIGDLAHWRDLELHSAAPLARPALSMAIAHGLTAYDAAYVALAGVVGGVVVTADRRLQEIGTSAGLPVASVAEA